MKGIDLMPYMDEPGEQRVSSTSDRDKVLVYGYGCGHKFPAKEHVDDRIKACQKCQNDTMTQSKLTHLPQHSHSYSFSSTDTPNNSKGHGCTQNYSCKL